jgi:hypothetical protein
VVRKRENRWKGQQQFNAALSKKVGAVNISRDTILSRTPPTISLDPTILQVHSPSPYIQQASVLANMSGAYRYLVRVIASLIFQQGAVMSRHDRSSYSVLLAIARGVVVPHTLS